MALNQFAALVSTGATTDASALDWSQVTFADVARARAEWKAKYTPAGANLRLAAVKGCLKTAWRLGVLDAEVYHRAADVGRVGGAPLQRGRAISDAEISTLFALCAADPNRVRGARDAAIFALFRTGVRVRELTMLDLADWVPGVDGEPDAVRVRFGKGAKERWAYLDRRLSEPVRTWLAVRGAAAGALICSARALARRGHLSPSSVLHICKSRAAEASLPRFTPHDWRRTTATALKLANIPLSDIKEFLGHANVQTTLAYFRDDTEAAKRRAAGALSGATNR